MRASAVLVAITLALSGCVAPPRQQPMTLRQQAPLALDNAAPATAAWPRASWWQFFADPQLDALIATALQSAPGLKTAQARIKAADAASGLVRAGNGVELAASARASRNRLSENGLISSELLGFDWYNQAELGLQLDVDFDWWGRKRSAITASIDRRRAASAEAAASQLILVTAIAAEYLGWQNDGTRLPGARELARQLERRHALQQLRTRAGIDEARQLLELEMELALARDALSLLEASQAGHRLALAALLGITPDRLALTRPGLAQVPALELPSDLGIGLIARRADIVASRWRVEAALQDIAEARAGYYPNLRLSALAGLSSLEFSTLFSAGSRVTGLGGVLYLPIFDFRGVRARYGARQADLELAAANYDEVVVAAARDVAGQISKCGSLNQRRRYAIDRLDAANRLQTAARIRHSEGMEDARGQIGAQAQALRVRDAALQIDGELALARLGLIKALGGGIEMPAAYPPPLGTNGRTRRTTD